MGTAEMKTLVSVVAGILVLGWLLNGGGEPAAPSVRAATPSDRPVVDRSPVDVVISPDQQWLVTANQTSHTVSLIDVASGKIADEVPCGQHPSALVFTFDGRQVLVSGTYSGDVSLYELSGGRLSPAGKISVGFEPRGIAISPDGKTAYVALTAADSIAVVDLKKLEVTQRISVAHWPRYLALSPDGTRLAVGTSGERSVSVVDTVAGKMLYAEQFGGINAGQMAISADGQHVYFPWMVYRTNPITDRNIRLGWVLGSRIGRIRLDGPARREAITLDPPGRAMSDPFGLALTHDEQWIVSAASGTHELLVYKLPDLPLMSVGGPGDHVDPRLANDRNRFYRLELGGRPMALCIARDNRRVFISNYLTNAVQEVDLDKRAIVRTIDLGGPAEPSLARRGEAIFYDGARSLDQWYSCHSCHYEGGSNAVSMDTTNDGTNGTFKTVLPLFNVTRTAPWTWHGWQTDLHAAMRKSVTETMRGPAPTDDDVKALVAYMETLRTPPSPYRLPSGALTEAAMRGQKVFQSAKAGCSTCHAGTYFTDGKVHDVGLSSPKDVYDGFNTPSLLGLYRKIRFLHNGTATSLEEVLTGPHNPDKVTGQGDISETDRADLIEYLKSL